jgi:ABC-type iron transport system FetAB ATPase subunit
LRLSEVSQVPAALPAAAEPNVVHIGRLRAEREAGDTARFIALLYQLEPADQIMISDRLRSMGENRRPQ